MPGDSKGAFKEEIAGFQGQRAWFTRNAGSWEELANLRGHWGTHIARCPGYRLWLGGGMPAGER